MIKNFFTLLSILVVFINSFSYIASDNSLMLPIVTVASEGLYPSRLMQAVMLDLIFSIYNPNEVNITLERVEYKIYCSGRFMQNETYESFFEELNIPSNQTETLKLSPVIDLSSTDEKTRNIFFEGGVEWNVTGFAYFDTTAGVLRVEIKKPKVEYTPDIYTPTSRITIEVKDEKWDHISGANVTLISKDEIFDKITNASGAVEFEIPSANYTLKVSKEGYSTHEESLDLSTPATMMKVIHLYPSIKLTVEIWDDVGKPISDVNVTFDSVDVGNFSKTTNVSGVAEFEIPRANYTLTVSKKGYLPHEDCLDLSKSIIESKVIQLKAELTWWQQYWSAIAWIIVICVAIPVILRLKKKSLFR